MSNKLVSTLLIGCLGVLLFSCDKDGDTIYKTDPTEQQASTAPLVTVIYDAEGVGDLSYNDLIYRGVEEAAQKYNLRTLQLSPQTYAEGLLCLETWFQQMSQTSDSIRRLCIVASPVYDEFVRKNNRRLEQNKYADLLYLENKTPLEGKGATLYMPYEGAMYEAGNIVSLFANNITLIGANPVNESVAEAIKGFTDGFNDRQDDIARGGSDQEAFMEGTVQTLYLGEKAGEGFHIDDETALILLRDNEINNEFSDMLIPVCGGAANTFVRLADITSAYTYMGVDCAQTSVFSHLSAVKHIDRAIVQCISQWLSTEGMPKHQSFGLASGYTEVVLHPHRNKGLVETYLTDNVRAAIHQRAIEREK